MRKKKVYFKIDTCRSEWDFLSYITEETTGGNGFKFGWILRNT
jgi:hypothetical protein